MSVTHCAPSLILRPLSRFYLAAVEA